MITFDAQYSVGPRRIGGQIHYNLVKIVLFLIPNIPRGTLQSPWRLQLGGVTPPPQFGQQAKTSDLFLCQWPL